MQLQIHFYFILGCAVRVVKPAVDYYCFKESGRKLRENEEEEILLIKHGCHSQNKMRERNVHIKISVILYIRVTILYLLFYKYESIYTYV